MLVADMFDLGCPNLEIADVGAPGAASLVCVQKRRFFSDVAGRDQTDCSACAGTFVLQ